MYNFKNNHHQSLKYIQFSGEILSPGLHSLISGQKPQGIFVKAGIEDILSYDLFQLESLYF